MSQKSLAVFALTLDLCGEWRLFRLYCSVGWKLPACRLYRDTAYMSGLDPSSLLATKNYFPNPPSPSPPLPRLSCFGCLTTSIIHLPHFAFVLSTSQNRRPALGSRYVCDSTYTPSGEVPAPLRCPPSSCRDMRRLAICPGSLGGLPSWPSAVCLGLRPHRWSHCVLLLSGVQVVQSASQYSWGDKRQIRQGHLRCRSRPTRCSLSQTANYRSSGISTAAWPFSTRPFASPSIKPSMKHGSTTR